MLTLQDRLPVKIFAGVLWAAPEPWRRALQSMAALWGECDCRSNAAAFTCTDYYADEMGTELTREFVSFAGLAGPETLAELKLAANRIERENLHDGARTVNIDVGYLDYHKVVLASTKRGPQKIYLGQGIWADITLMYENGRFNSLPWTFPDFRNGAYDSFFLQVRERYKSALREQRRDSHQL